MSKEVFIGKYCSRIFGIENELKNIERKEKTIEKYERRVYLSPFYFKDQSYIDNLFFTHIKREQTDE